MSPRHSDPSIPDADRTPADVQAWLDEIADLAPLLRDAAVTGPHQEAVSRPVPGSKPPMRLEPVVLLDERQKGTEWLAGMEYVDPQRLGLLPYLDGWVRDIEASLLDACPDLPEPIPDTPTITADCQWLSRHAQAASRLPQWPELVYGLRHIRAALRAATAGVRDTVAKPVPCPRCGDPLRQVGEKALWACDNGHETSVQAVTLRQAARIVGVPVSTLKRWARRPGLLPRVRESERRSLYDLGSIRAIVAESQLRGVP